MARIGEIVNLNVIKVVEFGFYLDAGELGKVLLPRNLLLRTSAPRDLSLGDSVKVFLYLDSEDRPVATTQMPKAVIGEFAYLKVVEVTAVGAFLDWGLDKDVLVPFAEQHRPMQVGVSYLVYLYLNTQDGRIVASSKIDKFLDDQRPHQFTPQQAVNLIIANSTELGYKAIINHSHWGVLYKDEVHQRLSFGQSIKGYIKHIRPDGKIDLSLQLSLYSSRSLNQEGGQETRDQYASVILNYLQKKNGFAPVHDKSDPQLIAELFGMSKAAFKKTIGGLYKNKIIVIEKEGIRLLTK